MVLGGIEWEGFYYAVIRIFRSNKTEKRIFFIALQLKIMQYSLVAYRRWGCLVPNRNSTDWFYFA